MIADLHLTTTNHSKTKLFIKFCQAIKTNYQQLFILGDLFDSWLGDDISINDYKEIIDCLSDLSKDIKIFFLAGNRDFLIKQEFAKQTGCIIIEEPYHLDKKYILIHGDQLCTDDIEYQKFRTDVRNPLFQDDFLSKPKKVRKMIAQSLREKSQIMNQIKPEHIMDVNQQSVDQFMSSYPNSDLIHGHTHRRNIHHCKHYHRIVLGDWKNNNGNALKITNQQIKWLDLYLHNNTNQLIIEESEGLSQSH